MLRRNLTRNGRSLRDARLRFVSFPKCGRTWFRVVWSAYVAALAEAPFALDPDGTVAFTHDLWEHRTTRSRLARLTGRHLLPPGAASLPVVWLVRDPRDVMVSLYHHLLHRQRTRVNPTSIGALLRHPAGMASYTELAWTWWHLFGDHAVLLRYEDAHDDPATAMRRFLGAAGYDPIDARALDQALRFGTFEAMRAREAAGDGPAPLRATDTAVLASYKAREGKVGGWRAHLEAADVAYCAPFIDRLPPALGYPP